MSTAQAEVCPDLQTAEQNIAKKTVKLHGKNTALNFEGAWLEYVLKSGCHMDSLEMYISKEQIKHLKDRLR